MAAAKPRNRILQDFHETGESIGSWLMTGSPMAAEILAGAGFSWLCVDYEHAPIGLAELAHIIRAVECRGATPIVRIPDHDPTTISRVLQAGALGIVAPHVRSAAEAQAIADACRFPPRGNRPVGTSRAATFGDDYSQWINDELVVIMQIEDPQGIEESEAIMELEGVDVGILGPKDLAQEMGVPLFSGEHEAAMAKFLAACQQANKPAGFPVADAAALRQRRQEGYTFFDLSSDFRFMQHKAVEELKRAREG